MKTYKSIVGLLAEWIFRPLWSFCEAEIGLRWLNRASWLDYQLPITNYELRITSHQPSKSPPNSTYL